MNAMVHLPTLSEKAADKTLFSTEALRGDRLFREFLEYWTQNQDIEIHVSVAQGLSGDPAR